MPLRFDTGKAGRGLRWRGSGCHLRDADGNEFIDLLDNYTASVHGHAVPDMNEAVSGQAAPRCLGERSRLSKSR